METWHAINTVRVVRKFSDEPIAEAHLDPASIVALLDSIPGAFERANQGLREIREGGGIPLEEF